MKKLLLLFCALLCLGGSGAWADVLPSAVVGTAAFQATALTTGASGHTITKDGSGNVTILPNSGNLGTYPNNYFTCTLVVKINVPSTTTAGVLCDLRQASDNVQAAQGLYMNTGCKLQTSWGNNGSITPRTAGSTLTTGEHTIIYTTGSNGAVVYIDGTSNTLTDTSLKASGVNYKAIYIPAAYAQYVTEVHFYSSIQNATNITSIVTECSNHIYASQETGASVTVPSGKMLVIDKDDNLSKYSFDGASNIIIASGKTLSLDKDGSTISSLTGCGTALQSTNITTTVTGNLTDLTLKATAGTLNYTGKTDAEPTLNGTTLSGVTLAGSKRIHVTGNITIENLAGNNQSSGINTYAFYTDQNVSVTLKGNCDFTKKSDETASEASYIGVNKGGVLTIVESANVKVGNLYNSTTLANNANITIESSATLEVTGYCDSPTVTNNGTLTMGGPLTTNSLILNEGSTINISGSNLSGATNVSGNATLNATGALTLSQAITVDADKALTINDGSNTVNLTSALSGSGNIVLSYFPTATKHPTLTSWTGAIEFPDKNNATNITEILNAWGNENSTIKLNNLTGYFSNNTTPVNPTLNILKDKTLTINNGYSEYPPTLSKLKGKGDVNISWGSCSSSFNLTIQKLFDFDGTLKTAKAPINVTKLVLDTDPAVDDLLIKTSGSVTLENLYINSEQTTAYSWGTKTVDEVNGIYVSALDQVQQNREHAVAAIAPYFTYIGSGVGKYTVTLGSTPYTNTSDLETAILGWATIEDCVDPIIAINQPTSAFYRIKSGSKYLQDVRKSDSATQRTLTDAVGANESAETIFYLNDNTFVGYRTGFGFGFSVCQTRDTEHLNTQLFTESAEMGKYTIQSQQGTCTSADYNVGYWGINDSDLSREADAASGACWTLESVTSLPVTFNGEFASFYSPVDLTIPDNANLKVYSGTLDGAYLRLNEVTGTLPANTGVILHLDGWSTPTTIDFPILSTATPGISDLNGTTAAQSVSTGTKLVLGYVDDTWGMYSYNNTVLNGFKAYMDMPATPVKGFTFSFDDETGISTVQGSGLMVNGSEIFNLAGQRMSRVQKGVNIVNGKKVLVK